MARLPDGDPAPRDGALAARALATLADRAFGVYVHVPFCASRCGYCDFNTYVRGEDGGAMSGYADALVAELALAGRVLGDGAPPAQTVFFGGGTPTLLPAADLARILAAVREHVGIAPGAEITTEANPESVDPASLSQLREAGFTRISLGMQSAVPSVLAALDRRHTPGRAVEAAHEARAAGFEQISVDLIYGAPGETAADWDASLAAAIAARPTHVSTYSLVVEPGTLLAAQVRRGEVEMPGEDVVVDRFEAADRALAAAGLHWYETCSWAVDEAAHCRHNLGYWSGGNWWGAGPGAHSHVGGVRWWNVLHPRSWAARVHAGDSPAAGRETPGDDAVRLERVMLGLRLASGVALDDLTDAGRPGRAAPPRRRPHRARAARGRPGRAHPARPAARRSGHARAGRLSAPLRARARLPTDPGEP